MKWSLLSIGLLAQSALASQPTNPAVRSCLVGHSVSSSVQLKTIASTNIYQLDNYKSGYDATYYLKFAGQEAGYGKNKNLNAVLYNGDIFPIHLAKMLPGTNMEPYDFNPYLADWSKITDANGLYLCVSFNFDGLGRSGSFQAVRGGYLLSISPSKNTKKLFFAVANTNLYKAR